MQGRVRGGGNDFEIFVAVHKFEGGGRAYLNTDRAFPASDSSSRSSYSYSSSSSSPLPLVLGSCCRCWILPHLFYPSSFFFFIFLFFFSGLDLHCLASANKLSRGPPYVDPIVIIIVSTCAVRKRAKFTLSSLLFVCAVWHLNFSSKCILFLSFDGRSTSLESVSRYVIISCTNSIRRFNTVFS